MNVPSGFPRPVAIVGIGNTLRGDDGAGITVAEKVRSWDLPGVHIYTETQLLPELIPQLQHVSTLIIVDACLSVSATDLCEVAPSHADDRAFTLGHAVSVGEFLNLFAQVAPSVPRAWLLAIPAREFPYGQVISPCTQSGMTQALAILHDTLIR